MLTAVVSFILIIVLTHGCKRTPFGKEGAGYVDKQRVSSIAPLSPYGFPLPISFPSPTHPVHFARLNVALPVTVIKPERHFFGLVPFCA